MAFANITEGRQHVGHHAHHPRHRHALPYAAIVLRGGYEEAGERGRYRLREGDVLLHDAFDAHCDRFESGACEILNLHLPADYMPPSPFARVRDLDGVVKRARRDTGEAAAYLLDNLEPAAPRMRDWPDELAAELWTHPRLSLGAWARAHRLSRESVSRTFSRIWAVTPARFRADVRARKAWRAIVSCDAPLAALAADAGFADQAHLTREVVALTGRSPGAWRRSNPFKTGAVART